MLRETTACSFQPTARSRTPEWSGAQDHTRRTGMDPHNSVIGLSHTMRVPQESWIREPEVRPNETLSQPWWGWKGLTLRLSEPREGLLQRPRLCSVCTNVWTQLLIKAFGLHRTLPLTPSFLQEAVQSIQTTYMDVIATMIITTRNCTCLSARVMGHGISDPCHQPQK